MIYHVFVMTVGAIFLVAAWAFGKTKVDDRLQNAGLIAMVAILLCLVCASIGAAFVIRAVVQIVRSS